jgi:hypothetical protein
MKITITGKTDYLWRTEYSVGEQTFEVSDSLKDATDEEIIKAIGNQISDMEFFFQHDKERVERTEYYIERGE